jgi:uridine phosphorylase
MEKYFKESELILNPDGSVYHISLRPEHVAPTVIVVGDQHRCFFHHKSILMKMEFKIQSREFVTHTGYLNNKRITVLSTGIGTDNIDIVINELDAAVNIDLESRTSLEKHTALDIIRLGTSGALQPDIEVDTFVAIRVTAWDLDGLLHYYEYEEEIIEKEMATAFIDQTGWSSNSPIPLYSESFR